MCISIHRLCRHTQVQMHPVFTDHLKDVFLQYDWCPPVVNSADWT